MTKAEAALLLNVAPTESPEELHRRFQDAYSDYQVRMANAPTAALRKTYQRNIEELRIAFHILVPELIDPTTDLPSSQPLPSVKEGGSKPTVVERKSTDKPARTNLFWIVSGVAVSFALLSMFLGIKLLSTAALRPQKESVKTIPQTDAAILLVMTDFECNWSVDGAPQLHLAKGGTIRVPVGLGKHMLSASTADGLDKIQTVVETARPQQEIFNLDFARVRAQRLDQESESKKQAEAELVRQKMAVEVEARRREQEEGTKRARLVQLWTDPNTGLLWQYRKDGANMSWVDANRYCQNSRANELSKWRLPQTPELLKLYDENKSASVKPLVKGTVCCWWSGSRTNNSNVLAVDFTDYSVNIQDGGTYEILTKRGWEKIGTLCVKSDALISGK